MWLGASHLVFSICRENEFSSVGVVQWLDPRGSPCYCGTTFRTVTYSQVIWFIVHPCWDLLIGCCSSSTGNRDTYLMTYKYIIACYPVDNSSHACVHFLSSVEQQKIALHSSPENRKKNGFCLHHAKALFIIGWINLSSLYVIDSADCNVIDSAHWNLAMWWCCSDLLFLFLFIIKHLQF